MSLVSKVREKIQRDGVVGLLKAMARRAFLVKAAVPVNPAALCLYEILKKKDVTIIQIGAFIGNTPNDPLFEALMGEKENLAQAPSAFRRILFVEPVKEHFEKLQANYAGMPGLFFENIAIAEKSGTATFYRLAADPVAHGFPEWLHQLGSLKKERMECLWERYEACKDIQDFYLKHRVAESVDCLSFEDLRKKYQIQEIDLLQMDVEGYEAEILHSIDFKSVPVRFINYECVLLQEKREDCERLLRENGYRLIDHDKDTFAYKEPDHALVKSWFEERH